MTLEAAPTHTWPLAQPRRRVPRAFTPADVAAFDAICEPASLRYVLTPGSTTTNAADYPLAREVASNIPIYDAADLRHLGPEARDAAMGELHDVLLTGPGVYVVRDAVPAAIVDRATAALERIIKREEGTGSGGGDHFAAPGHNSRVWNAFGKHAAEDPASFAAYYANGVLALCFESWLGEAWAVTAQVNVVRPGGRAQIVHRDYHLGFQSPATTSRVPYLSQLASQLLTLQGAVAHTDMPLESGPTLLLPYSQTYGPGYEAYSVPAFQDVFAKRSVQLPLRKGDALFFNPALFHAAGSNTTADLHRAANLLQVSAAWGKPMESVDRAKVLLDVWDELVATWRDGSLSHADKDALVAACCDGYSFPTNLDKDPPPKDGYCPAPMLDVVRCALGRGANKVEAAELLAQLAEKRRA
ncbi:uncharacterized protein LOC62_04G006085 [Vanrija pseudolonga]|uniref:Phytanoyl-CoA dioxygenase n=1 Tax=Vanrija pseudolonga TaxID=143232 RepID=A0AAF1BLT5_9TREE|nr:hypothetical protein LOC62_04G006085 [Vanrija pseudolonga]